MKVLVATEKPFAKAAVDGIKAEIEGAGNELVLLEKYTEKQQLLDAVADADAMIVRSDKVTPEVLDAAKQLKIVVRAGAGYDNVDCAYAKEKNVVVENTPGQNSNAVAELVFGLLVYGVRNFYNGKSGSELKGKKLGILAFGNVGRNVARIAKGSKWKFTLTTLSARRRLSSLLALRQLTLRTLSSRTATSFRCTSQLLLKQSRASTLLLLASSTRTASSSTQLVRKLSTSPNSLPLWQNAPT